MAEYAELTTFLGWCSVINIAVLLVATIMLVGLRTQIAGLHSRLLGLTEAELAASYTQYLSNYKVLITVFNVVPYFALQLMS